jgi:hypothetical protein
MALVPYYKRAVDRTVPLPREAIPTIEVTELLMKAAHHAIQQKSSGTREIRDIVLHPIRVAEHMSFSTGASAPVQSSPLMGARELQLRAHVVNQLLIRDFYSGERGQYMKDWVKSLYIVSEWMWQSYREGAAPELTRIECMPSRRPIHYTPDPIDIESASPSMRDALYKRHMEADPYQPFEKYVVNSLHPYFEQANGEDMVSIRVKRHLGAMAKTTEAMEHFMQMLQLEAQYGVLDPGSTYENPLQPALLAGIWALTSLHDNFSQDPNALDDPSFWLLQLLNHSLSRNFCYQKMTPGKREHPHLSIPTTPALVVIQARNRPALRSSTDLKYQRLFRALHLIVVQKVCLVLRIRFKRLHNVHSTKASRVDPTAFNKAAGFHKAHLNEAEESWRRCETVVERKMPMLEQQKLITHSQQFTEGQSDCVKLPKAGKLAGEPERRKVTMVFLQRTDLSTPVCTTVRDLLHDERVLKAKELLYNRVVNIDQGVALNKKYTDYITLHHAESVSRSGETQDSILEQMRKAWKEGDDTTLAKLTDTFTKFGKSSVHTNASNGRAAFIQQVLEGRILLSVHAHDSSFNGANEAIYGCGVPAEWRAKEGGEPTLGKEACTLQYVAESLFPSHGCGLTNSKMYGPGGTWDAERTVLLKLLRDLHAIVQSGHAANDLNKVVHLPMMLMCAKKWENQNASVAVKESHLQNVNEYITNKERLRCDMDNCLTVMHRNMHHAIMAAFRFVILRSLPGRVDEMAGPRRALPMRFSDDRVAHVARAHFYLMLAIAKHRDMRTNTDEPIFTINDNGLEMADPRLWSAKDWVGFCMITDVALSAEGGKLGREQASVALLPVPSSMISHLGIIELQLHSHETAELIECMATSAEKRYGAVASTSFLDLGPSYSGPRCVQLLRLNWGAYKYLRTNAKTEDLNRLSRTYPWKGCDVMITPEDRQAATALFVSEYQVFVQRRLEIVPESAPLPPLTDKRDMTEEDLFGSSDDEDADIRNVKARIV